VSARTRSRWMPVANRSVLPSRPTGLRSAGVITEAHPHHATQMIAPCLSQACHRRANLPCLQHSGIMTIGGNRKQSSMNSLQEQQTPKACVTRRSGMKFGACALITLAKTGVGRNSTASLPQAGDLLVAKTNASAGRVIGSDDVALGQPPIIAWAMDPSRHIIRDGSRDGQILLLRPNGLKRSGCTESAWDADGIVGFSAICTHAGCLVSGWKPAEAELFCPCHGSVFDAAACGHVVAGPAPRPLPALPLRIVSGALIAAARFNARIGASTGRTD
jgi:rieske iron-sulfur protein